MSDGIKFIWAKLPTFHKDYHEASNDALIAFDSFVPPIIFNLSKPFWDGNVQYNNKKTGVYKVDLIECLLRETYSVNIEGSIINSPVQAFPGSLTLNKVLNACYESDNPMITKMGYKQRQLIIYTQIKRELWSLFLPSEVIVPNEDYKSGEWTAVKPSSNDKEYDFDLSRGLLHYEETKKNEIGILTNYHRISNLKDEADIPRLIKLVIELKKYGKNTEAFADFDFKSQWHPDIDGNTYEPRGMTQQNK